VGPSGKDRQWRHDAIQVQFVDRFINRRKALPARMRDTLEQGQSLRNSADHKLDPVNRTEAARGLRRAREFVEAVREGRMSR